MKNPEERRSQPEQVERFKEAARALGCDDDESAFDEKLRRIAGHKPSDVPAKPGKEKARPDRG